VSRWPATGQSDAVRRLRDGALAVEVARAIRRHLAEEGISQADLAAHLGVTAGYVTNVLSAAPSDRGGRTTVRSLQRILDVLNLDVRVDVWRRS